MADAMTPERLAEIQSTVAACNPSAHPLVYIANDLLAENDRLAAENERLRVALKPFALVADDITTPLIPTVIYGISIAHIFAARDALKVQS
jgi:hypothetical protein